MIRWYSASAKDKSFFGSRSLPAPIATDFVPDGSFLPGGPLRYVKRAAAKKYRGSIDLNVYNHAPPVYVMDVGVWAGGFDGRPTTSFGVISGRDIFLCSWRNFCEGGWSYSKVSQHEGPSVFSNGLSGASKAFFEEIARQDRGFILSWARLPNKLGVFTSDDAVVVVLPDLHLHLQAMGPIDRFVYCDKEPVGQSVYGEKEFHSLDLELHGLIHLKTYLRERSIKMLTVQVGDMYEVWEAECILRHRLKELREEIDRGEEWLVRHGAHVRGDMTYMLQNHLVPRRMLHNSVTWRDWGWETTHLLEPEEMRKICIDASSTSDITRHIRSAHFDLFHGDDKIFDSEIRGNHDNFYNNRFWSDKNTAPEDFYQYPELRFETKGDFSRTQRRTLKLTFENSIFIEHGNKWDWHNNDGDWSKKGHGFGTVYDLVRGWMDRYLYSGSSRGWTDNMRSLGETITDLGNFEMRNFILLRADQLFRDENVRLVVMGHTHGPCLVEAPKNISLFWLHPHAKEYYNSKYCMPEARAIADRLRKAPASVLVKETPKRNFPPEDAVY